jgi:hypothetical protein
MWDSGTAGPRKVVLQQPLKLTQRIFHDLTPFSLSLSTLAFALHLNLFNQLLSNEQ